MGRLDGKKIIVFGGSGGIGAASARRFAQEGADIILADRMGADGREVCAQIAETGRCAEFVLTDITEADDVKNVVAVAVDRFQKIDGMLNCVGGSSLADGLIEDVEDEEFWRTIKVDLFGTWLACKYVVPAIAKAGGGAVINMSSAAAVRGQVGINAYSAAKGGVSALTRALARSYADKRVRINAIAPGAVGTPRVRAMLEQSEEIRTNVGVKQLLGVVEPDEIAELAAFLISDASAHMSGQILSVDGGLTI